MFELSSRECVADDLPSSCCKRKKTTIHHWRGSLLGRLTVFRSDRIDDHVVYDGVRYVRSEAGQARETT